MILEHIKPGVSVMDTRALLRVDVPQGGQQQRWNWTFILHTLSVGFVSLSELATAQNSMAYR